MNLNVPSLDKFTYQAPLNPLPGVVYVGREFKKIADIDTNKHKNKLARVDGVADKHVNALVESFKGGIDTTLPLPVFTVSYCSTSNSCSMKMSLLLRSMTPLPST